MAEDIADQAEVDQGTNGAVALAPKTSHFVLAENTGRRGGLIVNEGAHDAWLMLGLGPAVEKSGIYLKAGGGQFDLKGYDGPVYAISTEATNLTVVELEAPNLNLEDEDEAFTPAGPVAGTDYPLQNPGFFDGPALIVPGTQYP